MSDHTHVNVVEDQEPVLLGIVNESWRFAALFERVIAPMDQVESRRYRSRLAYFRERLQQELAAAGMHVAELEPGASYNPGMATTPINIDDFDEGDDLVIDQVIEPTIMGPDGIKRMGSVTLRKVS